LVEVVLGKLTRVKGGNGISPGTLDGLVGIGKLPWISEGSWWHPFLFLSY